MKKIFYSFKLLVAIIFISITIVGASGQTFTKITTGPVVSTDADSRSVNWVDINNDGLVDLFISNGKAGGQNNMLYINLGGGQFTNVTSDSIVLDYKPSDGATFADCDNDGDLDAFVVNWYNQNNLFYTNDGAGNFTAISSVPVVTSGGYSETASWGDYDNDGLLDLYVTRSGGTVSTNKNLLYHNDGGNAFTKILSGTPVTDATISRCVNWTDMDDDGDLDLFVTNEGNFNNDENIYRNDGSGLFTKITTGELVTNGAFTMSSSWGDYDNDGDLDVFLSNDRASNALFRNEGNLNFTKISSDTVSNTNAHSFSSAWSDIDNDGDLDLFVTNSYYTITKQLNFLYINNGDGSFSRINNTVPATDSSWSYGCAFADYDNDGFEDLAVATVNFNNIDEPDFLYHNDGNNNQWITIKLIGTITNKSAIGTKIRINAIINGMHVWQMREISAQTSYCGQNDLRAHFGLGNATIIDSMIVEWLSGSKEIFSNININQFITVTEGQGISDLTKIENNLIVKIYPNPTSEWITITTDKNNFEKGSLISISDMNGSTIFEQQIQNDTNKIEINLNSLPVKLKGLYNITIKNKSHLLVNKIVKF